MSSTPSEAAARRPRQGALHAVGLLLVACSTLAFELLLTRVFSVTLWYHFSFMAITVAMLGMTIGAIQVYSFRRLYRPERLHRNLALASLLFSGAMPVCFALQVRLGQVFQPGVEGLLSTAAFFGLITLPFVLSGVCVTLVLTSDYERVGFLYGMDLAGAAGGCLLVLLLLSVVDPTTAILLGSLLALAASLAFAAAGPSGVSRVWHLLALVLLVGAASLSLQHGGMSFATIKGFPERHYLYVGWNTFSRVTVEPTSRNPLWMSAWTGQPIQSAALTIDAMAGTDVLKSDGDFRAMEFLATDITSPAYHLRPGAKVLVLGCGGGRDVATALHFGNTDVTAVEMNDLIVGLLKGDLYDYSGGLAGKARLVVEEARSHLVRDPNRYDVIQMSLIDTTAAVASGAYLLSEHSLYTREAWVEILGHLSDRGIFSVTRNRYSGFPLEVHRCLTLAVEALRELGVEDPRRHVMLFEAAGAPSGDPNVADGMTTLLVSRAPFSDEDLRKAEEVAAYLKFPVTHHETPGADPAVRRLLDPATYAQALEESPFDVRPPTDDRPFFFFHLKPEQVWSGGLEGGFAALFYQKAVGVLLQLAVGVTVLIALFVLVPLAWNSEAPSLASGVYFAGLGLAYMAIEIALLQLLSVYLGHPIYSLGLVLFTMLLATGAGSFLARRLQGGARPLAALGLTLAVVWAGWALYPWVLQQGGASMGGRILVSLALLAPLGLAMGLPFPLGFSLVGRQRPGSGPWCWGVNGAASVLGSVLAIMVAVMFGLKALWGLGGAAYLVALAALIPMVRSTGEGPLLGSGEIVSWTGGDTEKGAR